jgi:hypothetical protein
MKSVFVSPSQAAPSGGGAFNPIPAFGPATAGTLAPADAPTTSVNGVLSTEPQSDAGVQALSKGEK